jgi:hypothetical protein
VKCLVQKEYQIRGTTFTDVTIAETVPARSAKHALGIIQRKYGSRLKKPFDIYTVTQFEDGVEAPEVAPQRPIDQLLPDEDILRIATEIRDNMPVDPDEYRLFRSIFKPIIQRLAHDLWNDVNIVTKEELEEELYVYVINEFLPRYTPGRGKLFSFIKMKLKSRVVRKWGREKYVNAEKPNARAKHEILEEYARGLKDKAERGSLEQEMSKVMTACKEIYTQDKNLTVRERRVLFSWIVGLGLHKKLVRSKKQIQALEIIYGPKSLTEAEAAQSLGLAQATLHKNKVRGEKNILKNATKELN